MNKIEGINDVRVLRLIIKNLSNEYDINSQLLKNDNKEELQRKIIKKLSEQNKNKPEIIESLIDNARLNIISKKEFDWIINDKYISHYVFNYIFTQENESYLPSSEFFAELKNQINKIEKTNKILTVVNHEERILEIINYFDLTCGNDINAKYSFMEELKKGWAHSYSDVKNFKWLTLDNSDSIDWAVDYLKKYNDSERKISHNENKNVLLINNFNPINDEEKTLAIYTTLRLWKCHHSEKRLLISNMNKAWQQRKLRRDREDKKAINCYVDKKVKEKLDILVKHKRCQMNQVITDLINDAYTSLKSDM